MAKTTEAKWAKLTEIANRGDCKTRIDMLSV